MRFEFRTVPVVMPLPESCILTRTVLLTRPVRDALVRITEAQLRLAVAALEQGIAEVA